MEELIQNRAKDNDTKSSSNILLFLDNGTNKDEMKKDIDGIGKLQKIAPENKKVDEPLIKIDKQGDIVSNFFSNFYRQLKNPSLFRFFKVSEYDAVNTAKIITTILSTPYQKTGRNTKMMKSYKIIQTN